MYDCGWTLLPCDMRKLIQRILVFGAGTLILSCAVLIGEGVYIRQTAENFIQDLRNLDSAADPTSYFRALQRKYGNRFKGEKCAADECFDRIVLDNRYLSVFHLVPKSEIRVGFILEHGTLESFFMEYTSEIFKENSPIVNFQEVFHVYESSDYFFINPHGRDSMETTNGIVDFARISTPKQKEAALALNLTCMTAFHGCKDISELLPTIWKSAHPGVVSSRLRSMADSIADDSQTLPD
jgi:hypothetical protein